MENRIYYTLIDGEVYQVKVKSAIIRLMDAYKRDDVELLKIVVEVATLGEFTLSTYERKGYNIATKLYKSMEDAINGSGEKLVKTCGCQVRVDTNDFDFVFPNIPTDAHIVEYVNVLGYDAYMMGTWVWDGIKPKEEPYMGIGENGKPCTEIRYDLVKGKLLHDDSQVCYPTKEECKKKNTIKVHVF